MSWISGAYMSVDYAHMDLHLKQTQLLCIICIVCETENSVLVIYCGLLANV